MDPKGRGAAAPKAKVGGKGAKKGKVKKEEKKAVDPKDLDAEMDNCE